MRVFWQPHMRQSGLNILFGCDAIVPIQITYNPDLKLNRSNLLKA